MAKQERETISIKPDSSQLKGLYAAFKRLDEDANKQLKDDVASISKWTAGEILAAAKQAPYMPRQAVLVAESIKFNRDRVPNVTIGGSKKAPVTRKVTSKNPAPKYGELIFGSEFGGVDYLSRRVNGSNKGANSFGKFGGKRFPPRSPDYKGGSEGYWIYPTLRKSQNEITSRWLNAVDKVLNKWDN